MNSLKQFKAQAIIFDKDGTLIDFHAMWGGWVVYLADQLENASGVKLRQALYNMMGYDETQGKVRANGKVAAMPMAFLRESTIELIQSLGQTRKQAEKLVEECWFIPDPILLAHPFTDMRELFQHLHSQNIKIAIATADDRAPTQAMIEAFDIEEYISTFICADDGIPSKPAPDMVLTLCERMGIKPAHVMVVGDTTSDLKMARASSAGLAVGVLSGVSHARDLAPFADVLIESIEELLTYSLQHGAVTDDTNHLVTGLNPENA